MTAMKVHEGNIITQTVERIKEGQMVLVVIGKLLQLGFIKTIHEDGKVTVFNDDEGYAGVEDQKDLRRLVVTDGERYAPLQNEDWAEACASKMIDSTDRIKYIIIERKIGESKMIRLARIFKPRAKMTKMTKEEIQVAFFESLEYADQTMSDAQKSLLFGVFWKKVSE